MTKYQFGKKEVPLFMFSSKDDMQQYIVTDRAVYLVGYQRITAVEIDNRIVEPEKETTSACPEYEIPF